MTKAEQVSYMSQDILYRMDKIKDELMEYMTEENMDILVSNDDYEALTILDEIVGATEFLFNRLDKKFGDVIKDE
jgi:hypothetical protein